MSSLSRRLRLFTGLIVVAILVAPAASALAQQKKKPKESLRYDPSKLRGVQLYLRTATRGPAGASTLPLLPEPAPAREATTPATQHPAARRAAVPLAQTPSPKEGPKLLLSSESASARPVAAPAAQRGRTTSIVLSMGSSRSTSGSISTPVSHRRGNSSGFSVAVRHARPPARNSAAVTVRGTPAPSLAVPGQESAPVAPERPAAATQLTVSTRSSTDAGWAPASGTMIATSLSPTAAPPTTGSGLPGSGHRGRAPTSLGGDYRLGAGDSIDVFVWRNPELSRTVPVRPDGRISLPLAGELVAAGKTVGELQAEITTILGAYIQVPTVSVTVTEIKSLVLYVLGNVATSGPLALDRNVDVLQAIAMAGGLNEFADKNGVTIIRTVNGQQVRIAYPYGDVVKGKVQAPQLVLRAGDVIYVP